MLESLLAAWPILLILAGLAVLVGVLKQMGLLNEKGKQGRKRRTAERVPDEVDGAEPVLNYTKCQSLLTNGELGFYRVLQAAVSDRGGHSTIMAKVRLGDLVESTNNGADSQAALNKVQSKHVDFVLCDSKTLRPLVVIELDDATHGREDRRKADAAKGHALKSAGLPLLRVKAAGAYDKRALGRGIDGVTGGG